MSAISENPTELSPRVRTTLLDRIPQTVQKTTAAVIASTEASVFVSFAEWAETSGRTDEEWAARYVASVRAGQTQLYGATAGLHADYVALASGRPAKTPLLSDVDLVGFDDPWTMSPAKRLSLRLSEGLPFLAAVDSAGRYASGLSSVDISSIGKTSLRDVSASNPNRVRGQRKVVSGGACGWCLVVADQVYGVDARIPSHEFDRCGDMVVVENDDFVPGQLSGGRWEEVIDREAIPSGELLEGDRFAALERGAA